MPPDGIGRPGVNTETAQPPASRATEQSIALSIPDLVPDVDTLTAALLYAAAGWYVLPVRRGTKDPGSVVGKGWQRISSRDPKVIAAWFSATDHGIALHVGRSGAVVFDVDHPDKLPDVLRRHLATAPFQSTRPDVPGRGHYVFRQPPGRTLGNGTGKLGGEWGEVRGLNGVIIAAPSRHADGGEYRWVRTGLVPALPENIADLLPDGSPAEDAAPDAVVAAFMAEHDKAERPEILHGWRKALTEGCDTKSRHGAAISVTTGALKEARLGCFPAQAAVEMLEPIFVAAATRPPRRADERQRTERQARDEYRGILAWAVAQANAADLDEVRRRTEEKMPEADIDEVDSIAGTTPNTNGDKAWGKPLTGEQLAWFNEMVALREEAQITDDLRPDGQADIEKHSGQLGMAIKMAKLFAGKLIYVNGIGWHRWDGRRWARDGDGAARRAVHAVIKRDRRIIRKLELSLAEEQKRLKAIARYENASAISGILTEAAALSVFSVTVDRLDAGPFLFNCVNGAVDLHTMELRDHNPADLITKVANAAYNPDAAGADWQKFLQKVLPDKEIRDYLRRVLGVALLGMVIEHNLVILTGIGANGKGTFYKAANFALGDYADMTDPELFMDRKGAHPTGDMTLLGLRLAVVSESGRDRALDEARMKRFTGGDTISARYLYQNQVTFEPSHTAVFITNHLPKVSGDDEAVWRRLPVVPFDVVIPDAEQDKHLEEKLQAGRRGPGVGRRRVERLPRAR